jgi:hypothetical protein
VSEWGRGGGDFYLQRVIASLFVLLLLSSGVLVVHLSGVLLLGHVRGKDWSE